MAWSLHDLRVFAAVADEGTFTDAALTLDISQASASRRVASLERIIGERLINRLPRRCELTAAGVLILREARPVLAEADKFSTFVSSRHATLRLGYAWAALGQRTPLLQRRWATHHSPTVLELLRCNTPTGGLSEGRCDVAVVRGDIATDRFNSVVVGWERRMVAFSRDDPAWGRRRQLTMAEIAQRTVIIDPRVGTTTGRLWDGSAVHPKFYRTDGVDSWLDAIAGGRGVGMTAEATAYHHPRPGVLYRPVKDGPHIPVRLIWRHGETPAHADTLIREVTALYT